MGICCIIYVVMCMLQVKNLSVIVADKVVLSDFNLDIDDGSVHVVMGPNGVGKSTLSRTIMGDNNYHVTRGKIIFNNEDITKMTTDLRSRLGIFLAMQSPLEIDGVSNQDFLRTAMSSHMNRQVGLYEFIKQCEAASGELKMDKNLIHRSLNVGFSGGEKKKNEVLQLKLLKPSFIILDELDSGLDVDSLKIVAKNILKYKKENPTTSILIITHLSNILEYITPDYVHVISNGKIIKTGDYSLAKKIEKEGYSEYIDKSNTIIKD